jgi:hypothetical protein
MPVLKALKAFTYDHVKLRAGDLFKCKDRYVPIVVHAKLATRPEVQIAKPVPAYQTRHMEAERQPSVIAPAKTVLELRAEAEAKGIHLPKGYIPKVELLRIIAKG